VRHALTPRAQTVAEEGVRALFKGWLPSYYRLGPHFILVRVLCSHSHSPH
jgi:hypothetical protein